jgi:pimeloyl-ACP methyl ester carboxylesterase
VDATCWREVIALLQVERLSVVAVRNPLSALADDVDAVTRALDHQPGRVVLVGHGYGGTVITQAGNHERVAGLVYIAACAPDVGESTADVDATSSPLLVDKIEVDARGFLHLTPDAVLEFLAHDLPQSEGLVLAAAQHPIRATALLDRVTRSAWRTKPCWYAVTEADRMFSPALQREIAKRIGAEVVRLRAGHAPFLSKPRETADVILTATRRIRG